MPERDDDFFDGNDLWEDVDDGAADRWQEEPRRERRTLAGDIDRLREGSGLRNRSALVAGGGLVVILVIVLAVVLTSGGGGGNDQAALPTIDTTPVETVPTGAATTTAPPAPAPIVVTVPAGTTLSVGDSGPTVRALQRALRRVGHDPGAADGTFGPGTEAAVKAFQQEAGIDADGIVGPATARALVQAQRG